MNLMKKILLIVTIVLSFSIIGLGYLLVSFTPPDHALYKESSTKLPTDYLSFDAYIKLTKRWLSANREFVTNNKEQELLANTPFEIKTNNKGELSRGIILVHGLGDSPYSFIDIANELSEQGFQVRVLLLPGHGSKPADLISTTIEEWKTIINSQVAMFTKEVDHLYLGGFSTGANLVTTLAIRDESIKGLILFSPAFRHRSGVSKLSHLLNALNPWPFHKTKKANNFAKYDVVPNNAAVQFNYTSEQVTEDLAIKFFDRPTFMVVSEKDNVIDTNQVLTLFEQRFTHPSSRLLWFGKDTQSSDKRIIILDDYLPKSRISNFSHMSVLFAPNNNHYGINANYRICDESSNSRIGRLCASKKEIWYSAFGYKEKDKIYARLTYNPWFTEMSSIIDAVFNNDDRSN
jgi:esterase/lipase